MTCAGRPGSEGYEIKDANTYAGWNVDYLKLDTCAFINASAIIQYTLMRDALNATGRPIFYSLCGKYMRTLHTVSYTFFRIFLCKGGVGPNDTWPPTTGNSWRTTTDIQGYWAAVIANIDYVRLCYRFQISYMVFFLFY
jgi:alpha-galactosidase